MSQTDAGCSGNSWEPRRTLAGHSPGITLRILGPPPASAGPRNVRQARSQWAGSRFPVFGLFWKVGERQRGLSGGQWMPALPDTRGFRELEAALVGTLTGVRDYPRSCRERPLSSPRLHFILVFEPPTG